MKSEILIIKGKTQLSGMFIYNEKDELLLLHKIKHDHYETPGGKVEILDLEDPKNPTNKDFRNTAIRETFEELGQEFIFEEPDYVKGIDFIKPNGKEATAHKFKTKIVFGNPKINEPNTFDEIKWFSKEELKILNNQELSGQIKNNKQIKDSHNSNNSKTEKLSPDLKLFLKENLI